MISVRKEDVARQSLEESSPLKKLVISINVVVQRQAPYHSPSIIHHYSLWVSLQRRFAELRIKNRVEKLFFHRSAGHSAVVGLDRGQKGLIRFIQLRRIRKISWPTEVIPLKVALCGGEALCLGGDDCLPFDFQQTLFHLRELCHFYGVSVSSTGRSRRIIQLVVMHALLRTIHTTRTVTFIFRWFSPSGSEIYIYVCDNLIHKDKKFLCYRWWQL